MITHRRDLSSPEATTTASSADGLWNEAENYLHRQLWPDSPPRAHHSEGEAPAGNTKLADALNDSMAERGREASARLREQTAPIAHALQHLCGMMSDVLEESSLQALVVKGALKPQEAILLRAAIQELEEKMSGAA